MKRKERELKQRNACRDIIGIIIFSLLLFFIIYDKNFIEDIGPRKTFSKIDRIITAKLVADSSFISKREQKEWLGEISNTLEAASEIFEREFGIRIIGGDIEIWKDTTEIAKIEKLRHDIKSGPCDIIIGFTKRELDPDNPGAFGRVIANTIIIKPRGNFEKRHIILAHEIAHLFWAQHIDKVEFLMSRDGDSNREKIDTFNWRIIIFNKYKNFHKHDFFKKILHFL